MYRKDLWDEIGMKPDTWEDIRIGGAKLKAKGHPVGIALGAQRRPEPDLARHAVGYGASEFDESGKHVTLNSKETLEAVKFVRALYKEAMDAGSPVLGRCQQQPLPGFGRGLDGSQPDLGLPDRSRSPTRKLRRQDLRLEDAGRGPVRRSWAAARRTPTAIWQFARNKDTAIEFLRYYADHWVEAFKASTGYNHPLFANIVPKPMPILSNDPTSHPADKLQVLRDRR